MATNQGVVGSNPASRARQINELDATPLRGRFCLGNGLALLLCLAPSALPLLDRVVQLLELAVEAICGSLRQAIQLLVGTPALTIASANASTSD